MSDAIDKPAVDLAEGGFRYLPGSSHPFATGVAALAGHGLVRVRLRRALPLAEGLDFAARYLARQGRSPMALAGCELRSPRPMSPAEFGLLNAEYVVQLRRNGFAPEPVARSNMAPLWDAPAAPALVAFTYAAPADDGSAGRAGPDFLLSGKPEIDEAAGRIVLRGDTSPEGMQAKAGFVLDALKRAAAALGGAWEDLTGAQAYTVQPLEPVLPVLRENGLLGIGIVLFPGYPPVTGLDFEIDVRAVGVEVVG
jgi:hypothetical protein